MIRPVRNFFFISLLSSALLVFSPKSQALEINDLILMTEQFPPYNYEKEGKVSGISVELMEKMLNQLNTNLSRKDIFILPWARSYRTLQKKPGSVLFVVTRTPARENLFKWVGPITQAKNVLLTHSTNKIAPITFPKSKTLRFAAVRDDAAGQLLSQLPGMKQSDVMKLNSVKSGVLMLMANRVDVFAYDENVAKWTVQNLNLNPNLIHPVYTLTKGEHYFAFHKDTPTRITKQFQQALDTLKSNGEYKRILAKYLD